MKPELSNHLAELVDHLRARPGEAMSVADTASVTEVLIGSLRSFITSVDDTIYREFCAITAEIDRTKREIRAMQPENLAAMDIPRAGQELNAIVSQTEAATHSIMTAAETLLALELDDAPVARRSIADNCTRVFEACAFQDITGQRIAKVIDTLNIIDTRLAGLMRLVEADGTRAAARDSSTASKASVARDPLLNGPAAEGEAVDQSEVDALFA